MSYTLGQAARASGKSKMTIARAVKAGRISAAKTDSGVFMIEPAELHRVYPVAGNGAGTVVHHATGEVTGLSLADLLAERDRRVTEQAETIRDLRQRLDAITELHRLTLSLLPNQLRRPWWRRWFG
jgi:hypothetical protein